MSYRHRVYIGPYILLSNEVEVWLRDTYKKAHTERTDYNIALDMFEGDLYSPEFVDGVFIPYNRKGLIHTWDLDENKCKAINFDAVSSVEALEVFNEKYLTMLEVLRKYGSVEVKYGVVSYVS